MRDIIVAALRASLVTWVLCGIAYPLVLVGLGQWLMPVQANGSLESESRWHHHRLAPDRASVERPGMVSWPSLGDHRYRPG